MKEQLERLFRENQAVLLRERRGLQRQPFVRPVLVRFGPVANPEEHLAFSRDLSYEGIALITDFACEERRVGTLEIHSLSGSPVRLRAEVRYCQPYGKGWHVSGWHFLGLG